MALLELDNCTKAFGGLKAVSDVSHFLRAINVLAKSEPENSKTPARKNGGASRAPTVAAAKTIAQVLWDDLNFEREFYLIGRDTYKTIPTPASMTSSNCLRGPSMAWSIDVTNLRNASNRFFGFA